MHLFTAACIDPRSTESEKVVHNRCIVGHMTALIIKILIRCIGISSAELGQALEGTQL